MAPKPKQPKLPGSRFLFVNEDASTVTRTINDAELERTKQSHVQHQNFMQKHRVREQSVSSSPQTNNQNSVSDGPVIISPLTEVSSSQEESLHGKDQFDILQNIDIGESQILSTGSQSHRQSTREGLLEPFVSTTRSPPPANRQGIGFDTAHPYRRRQFFLSPSLGRNASSPKPSNIASTRMPLRTISSSISSSHQLLEQWAPPLIRYYNTIILPAIFWRDIRKVPMGRMRHAQSIHLDMAGCMESPAHFYAFLASTSTQMAVCEGRILLPDVSPEDVQRVPTFFMTKAIQALRLRLANGDLDHGVAVDVHRLYSTGIHTDHYELAEPHFRALLSMVEMLGGLSTFNDYQLEQIILMDCDAALKRLSAPRLLATWDPGPLAEDVLQAMKTQGQHHPQTASRLIAMCQGSCEILTKTFLDLSEVLKMSTYLDNLNQYVLEHYKWCSWRTLTILHRLLSMPLHHKMCEKMDAVRIATVYWTATKRSPVLAWRVASRSNYILRAKLESTYLQSLWQPHPECLLWVVVFGSFTTSNGHDLEWYANIARRIATQAGVNELQELEDLFTTLLYDPISQRDMLVRFAELIWPAMIA